MEKLIASLSRNKNTVIAVLALIIVSMATVFLFWDADLSKNPNVSVLHHSASITTHNSSEEANLNEKWKNIINNVEDDQFVFVLNTEAEFEYVDEATIKAMGYAEKEMINQKFFPFVNDKDLPELMVAMIKVMQTGESLSNIGPYRIKEKASEGEAEKYLHLIATITPIKDEDGNVTQLVVVHKDITKEVAPNSNTTNKKKIRNQENEQKRRIVELISQNNVSK